jgi:hypothetical protein
MPTLARQSGCGRAAGHPLETKVTSFYELAPRIFRG